LASKYLAHEFDVASRGGLKADAPSELDLGIQIVRV
jgi:hypothetical protein